MTRMTVQRRRKRRNCFRSLGRVGIVFLRLRGVVAGLDVDMKNTGVVVGGVGVNGAQNGANGAQQNGGQQNGAPQDGVTLSPGTVKRKANFGSQEEVENETGGNDGVGGGKAKKRGRGRRVWGQ